MNRKHLTRPAAIAVVALLVAGSLAYAAWSVNGSGTGAASATSAVSLSLTPGSPSDALFPGASADVATTITNSNPFPVHVTAISLDSGQGSAGLNCRVRALIQVAAPGCAGASVKYFSG